MNPQVWSSCAPLPSSAAQPALDVFHLSAEQAADAFWLRSAGGDGRSEILAYLGDKLLGFLVSEVLLERLMTRQLGTLPSIVTQIFGRYVSNGALAQVARRLGIENDYLERCGSVHNHISEHSLGTIMEALLQETRIHHDFSVVRNAVANLIDMIDFIESESIDASNGVFRNVLEAYCSSRGFPMPVFYDKPLKSQGKDSYMCDIRVTADENVVESKDPQNRIYIAGAGIWPSIDHARENACHAALQRLRVQISELKTHLVDTGDEIHDRKKMKMDTRESDASFPNENEADSDDVEALFLESPDTYFPFNRLETSISRICSPSRLVPPKKNGDAVFSVSIPQSASVSFIPGVADTSTSSSSTTTTTTTTTTTKSNSAPFVLPPAPPSPSPAPPVNQNHLPPPQNIVYTNVAAISSSEVFDRPLVLHRAPDWGREGKMTVGSRGEKIQRFLLRKIRKDGRYYDSLQLLSAVFHEFRICTWRCTVLDSDNLLVIINIHGHSTGYSEWSAGVGPSMRVASNICAQRIVGVLPDRDDEIPRSPFWQWLSRASEGVVV